VAAASGGASGQIAGHTAALYADARMEGVKTAAEYRREERAETTRTGHERGKGSAGELWGRAVASDI